MKRSINLMLNALMCLMFGVEILMVLSDVFGSIIEILSSGSYKYHNFTQWYMFNQSNVLFSICIFIMAVISVLSLYFSYKHFKTDKLKAILIMIIPLLLYNVFVFINLR